MKGIITLRVCRSGGSVTKKGPTVRFLIQNASTGKVWEASRSEALIYASDALVWHYNVYRDGGPLPVSRYEI